MHGSPVFTRLLRSEVFFGVKVLITVSVMIVCTDVDSLQAGTVTGTLNWGKLAKMCERLQIWIIK